MEEPERVARDYFAALAQRDLGGRSYFDFARRSIPGRWTLPPAIDLRDGEPLRGEVGRELERAAAA